MNNFCIISICLLGDYPYEDTDTRVHLKILLQHQRTEGKDPFPFHSNLLSPSQTSTQNRVMGILSPDLHPIRLPGGSLWRHEMEHMATLLTGWGGLPNYHRCQPSSCSWPLDSADNPSRIPMTLPSSGTLAATPTFLFPYNPTFHLRPCQNAASNFPPHPCLTRRTLGASVLGLSSFSFPSSTGPVFVSLLIPSPSISPCYHSTASSTMIRSYPHPAARSKSCLGSTP